MEITQRGSGIWSYTFLSAGAILFTSVPATIITSDWRGLALKITPDSQDPPTDVVSKRNYLIDSLLSRWFRNATVLGYGNWALLRGSVTRDRWVHV